MATFQTEEGSPAMILKYLPTIGRMQAAELQLCAGRVPYTRETGSSTPTMHVKDKEQPMTEIREIEAYCADIAGNIPWTTLRGTRFLRSKRMKEYIEHNETVMADCHNLIDAMARCESKREMDHFSSVMVPKHLENFLERFEDDFYAGSKPGAADISLFNTLNLITRANIGWEESFPELKCHYDTVSRMCLIPAYLDSTRDAPLGF